MSILVCCALCTSQTHTHVLTDIRMTIVNISMMLTDISFQNLLQNKPLVHLVHLICLHLYNTILFVDFKNQIQTFRLCI